MIEKISRYEIISLLGQGGLGVVYKAWDPSLAKTVAIKLLSNTELNDDEVIRFQREAKALKDIRHSAIPEIYNFSISDTEKPYMVMEFIDGTPLSALLAEESTLPPDMVVDLSTQICEALAYTHSHGIIHRDIKPSNILLVRRFDAGYEVKLVDFGIARVSEHLDRSSQDLTATGAVVGSPSYMSPEQVRSEATDSRTDIYSLGCVMFELLTGKPPFVGGTALTTMTLHVTDEPEFGPEHSNELPEELQACVLRCLAKKPEQRYQSATDLLEALRASIIDADETADIESVTGSGPDKSSNQDILKLLLILAFSLLAAGYLIEALVKPSQPSTNTEVVSSNSMQGLDDISDAKEFLFENIWEPIEKRKRMVWKANPELEDSDFKRLRSKENVRAILTMHAPVTGSGLKDISDLPIDYLTLCSPNLNDQGLACIGQMKHLRAVHIGYTDKTTEQGLDNLLKLPNLKSLALNQMKVPDHFYSRLSSMGRLRELTLIRMPIDDKSIKLLSRVPHLDTLYLRDLNLDDGILRAIGRLTSLDTLGFVQTNLNDRDADKLVDSCIKVQLKTLYVINNKFTQDGLLKLSRIGTLERLHTGRARSSEWSESFAERNPRCKVYPE